MTAPRPIPPVSDRLRAVRWYAETPGLRLRQQLLDVVVLVAVYALVRLGTHVHDVVDELAGPGRQLQDAGGGLSGSLGDAADRVDGLPFAGDQLRKPFDAAASASRAVADAGAAQQTAVHRLALVLGLVVALLPIAYLLVRYLPSRVAFARQATAGNALRGDVELLALRAATNLPLSTLATLGPDPVTRWRRGEPGAAEALAALELRSIGLLSSPAPVSSPGGPATGRPPGAGS